MTDTSAAVADDATQAGSSVASTELGAAPASSNDNWIDWGTVEDPELKAWGENKGFPDALTAMKSYREAEKLIGSHDKLALPEDGKDLSEWAGWDKLGAPKEAKEYAEVIKPEAYELPEGMEWDGDLMSAAMEIAAKNRIPVAQLKPLADMIVEQRKAEFQAAAEIDAQDRRAVETLYTEWGAKKDVNLEHARRAAKELGFDDALIGEASQFQGSAKLIATLAKAGERMAEGGLITGGSRAMSVEQAKSELDAMKADPNVMDAIFNPSHAQHKSQKERFERLSRLSLPNG